MQMITETNAAAATSPVIQGARMPEAPELKAELRWCIENGNYGPRTGAALRWALEAIEELEKEGEGA
ncbi:hypothetical protein [Paraburkholderia monticola]|nr:hypothetical protein [Paraburkholderia monticola]